MKNKIFAIILAIAIIAIPAVVSADSPPKDTGKKIGDKVVFSNSIVATYQGKNAQGKEVYKATIEAPKYQDDLKTLISTEWQSRDNNRFVSTGNLIYAEVNGSQIELLYKGNRMIWTPVLSIDGKTLTASNPKILAVDPINANYRANTLEWNYGNGIVRHFRQIEGVYQDFYIFDKAPDGDIVIAEQVTKSAGYNYDTPAYAVDADNKPIKITQGNVKTVKLSDLKDVKYPILIDPTNNYVTSASDGYLGQSGVSGTGYTVVRDATTSNVGGSSGALLYIGQSNNGANTYMIYREYVFFDTSNLPDAATITVADLSLYSDGSSYNMGAGDGIQITNGMATYPHDPVVSGDYSRANYSGNGGTMTRNYTAGYHAISLNATGLSWINATGYTKFALHSLTDIAGTSPASVNEFWSVYAYEKGAGYRPKLDITFTVTVPTVTTDAATAVVCTSATLNGSIDNTGGDTVTKQGFVWDTATHAEPTSVTAPAASAYASNDIHTAASYAVGDYTHDLAGLTEGDTYYARFVAYNSGGYKYGGEIEFTCWSDPIIAVAAAQDITTTTATLQSNITDDGGDTVEVRFGWGATDQGNNIAAYDHFSAYAGSYSTGDSPVLPITGLPAHTLCYFNVEAQTACGTDTGTSTSFTTETSVGSPTSGVAIPSYNTVTLTWHKGTGAPDTVIRRSTNACPANEVGGVGVYNSTASSYIDTGLTSGTDYCYYIVGHDTVEGYSASALTLHATTLSGAVASDTFASVPTQPTGWNTDPNATAIATYNPLAPYIADTATTLGMPLSNFWFLLYMLGVLVIAFVVYKVSHNTIAVIASIMITMSAGSAMILVPVWLTVPILAIGIAVIVMQRGSNV
jgi:hypothetical protein